jgi:hypothetical protein
VFNTTLVDQYVSVVDVDITGTELFQPFFGLDDLVSMQIHEIPYDPATAEYFDSLRGNVEASGVRRKDVILLLGSNLLHETPAGTEYWETMIDRCDVYMLMSIADQLQIVLNPADTAINSLNGNTSMLLHALVVPNQEPSLLELQ